MRNELKQSMPPFLMILLLMLLVALTPGCATNKRIIFVSESVTVGGNPEVVLKLTESTEANAAYYDGESWVEVEDVELPAGWLLVSNKVLGAGK